jgi:hypothetical protein
MFNDGYRQDEVMAIVGWDTSEMAQHYSHIHTTRKRSLMELIYGDSDSETNADSKKSAGNMYRTCIESGGQRLQ